MANGQNANKRRGRDCGVNVFTEATQYRLEVKLIKHSKDFYTRLNVKKVKIKLKTQKIYEKD